MSVPPLTQDEQSFIWHKIIIIIDVVSYQSWDQSWSNVAAVPSVLTCACLADLAIPVRACLVDYVRVLLSIIISYALWAVSRVKTP